MQLGQVYVQHAENPTLCLRMYSLAELLRV